MNNLQKTVLIGLVAAPLMAHQIIARNLDVFDGCPLDGDRPNESAASLQKNRYDSPGSEIKFSVADLATKTAGAFPQGLGAVLTGYVSEVKPGGSEACNCHSAKDIDTHIYVSIDAAHAANKQSVIVEVTPRTRSLNPAWTQAYLRTLVGKTVAFTGWLFYDAEHEPQAETTNSGNVHDWRASCWEVHPVTGIEIAH